MESNYTGGRTETARRVMGERGVETSRNEGEITSRVEKQTARVPSITFLTLAGASIVGSLGLFIAGRERAAIFVGEWAPTFLILGLYNKLVKETEDVPRSSNYGLGR